jgi:hypothetical protein
MLSGVSMATQAILSDMPESADLHLVVHDGQTTVLIGNTAIASYADGDLGMRNTAAVTLTNLGFPGVVVAEKMGLTPEYVSELRGNARRHGSAGLMQRRGRPPKLTPYQVAEARRCKAAGMCDAEIARRFKVDHKTAAKAVAGVVVAVQPEMDLPAPQSVQTIEAPGLRASSPDAVTPATESMMDAPAEAAASESEPEASALAAVMAMGAARIGTGRLTTRYAGAMLLHPFLTLVNAETILAASMLGLTQRVRSAQRYDDIAVLTGTCVAFGVGFKSVEQFKFPDRAEVGPVVGIDVLPELRTLRPRLAQIADRCDPLAVQRSLAQAMLAAEPNVSGVYFVDEHFMPYTGARPVGSGWNTKRRHAEPGRVDTHICDPKGRAVCFTNGEPSSLSKSLPGALKQLRQILGPQAPILLGFDRGGAYPGVFKACSAENAHWITYRRAPLVATTGLPIVVTITHPRRKPTTIAYTDETVTIKKYGQARQITLFEKGKPVLQILTSDTSTCPGALVLFMRARWRIENLFKYLDFYGIDYLADYHATVEANTRKVDNPERKKLKEQLKKLTAERDKQRECIGTAHTDRNLTVGQINAQSVAAQKRINVLDKQIQDLTDMLTTAPAKLPANVINPEAERAIHRAHRRALQMVLRLLAANAENWLAYHLNAYLEDHDEYRATARRLLELGGTITYEDKTITVELNRPNTPRLARAVTKLLDEINHIGARIPGDPRPISYTTKS